MHYFETFSLILLLNLFKVYFKLKYLFGALYKMLKSLINIQLKNKLKFIFYYTLVLVFNNKK